jgi:hypothetical protein
MIISSALPSKIIEQILFLLAPISKIRVYLLLPGSFADLKTFDQAL